MIVVLARIYASAFAYAASIGWVWSLAWVFNPNIDSGLVWMICLLQGGWSSYFLQRSLDKESKK